MLHAIIKKGAETQHLELPTDMFYYEMFKQGINRDQADFKLTDRAGDEIRTRLLADDPIWDNFAKMCGETDTLAQINSAAYKLANTGGTIKTRIEENLIQGRYQNLIEFEQGIEQQYPYTANFYCPLMLKLSEDGISDMFEISNLYLKDYEDQIKAFVEDQSSKENMAMFYDKNAAGKEKLYSVNWDIERRGNEVYGCIRVRLSEPFTQEETQSLKNWIIGQNSDGFGESMEQMPILVDEGELYVSFFDPDKDFLYDDQEADQYIPDGPEVSELQL